MWQNKQLRLATIGAASLGVAYLAYLLYKDHKIKATPKQRETSQCCNFQLDDLHIPQSHSNYSNFYFDKEQKLGQIAIYISSKGPSVEDIYLYSPAILIDEYEKYTKQIRKRRRLIRKVNENQYIFIIRNYEVEIRQLMQRGRMEVLQEIGLSVDQFESMENAFQMFQDLQDLKKKAVAQLREKTITTVQLRTIPKEKLGKIMEEEIGFIQNRLYERMKTKLQQDQTGISQEEIHKIISTLCDDIIYEKYGYEREEIQKQMKDLPLLAKDLKKQRQTLFANIVQFNIENLESGDEEQEQGEQSMLGDNRQKMSLIDTEQSFEHKQQSLIR